VTGAEAAARLRAIALALEGAEDVELDCRFRIRGDLDVVLLAEDAPKPQRSGAAARAKAYRERKRAARDARDADTSEPVTPVTNARDGERDEKRDASRSEPLPTPLPFRSGSSGDEKEKSEPTTTQSARARVTSVTQKRDASRVTSERLHSLAEALEVPIAERARYVLEHAHEAEWLEPQRWPELERLAAAYEASTGQKARLGRYHADAGVRAMVSHYAADYTPDELEHVYGAVASQRWFNEPGKRHGLSSVTVEVVRRTLAGRREDQAEQAKVDELIQLATRPRPRPPARAAASLSSLLPGVMPDPEEATDAAR
jgi:hypothetical protein